MQVNTGSRIVGTNEFPPEARLVMAQVFSLVEKISGPYSSVIGKTNPLETLCSVVATDLVLSIEVGRPRIRDCSGPDFKSQVMS